MITLVTGVELLPEIQKMCSRDEDIYFAVSYWSGGAAERIKGFTKGQLHVVLDIHSGGTNPRDLRVLMEWLGDRVKIHPDLHAKVYASETLALLGSANATSPGLQMRETGRVGMRWTRRIAAAFTSRKAESRACDWSASRPWRPFA